MSLLVNITKTIVNMACVTLGRAMREYSSQEKRKRERD
jgi:hypothetical protein